MGRIDVQTRTSPVLGCSFDLYYKGERQDVAFREMWDMTRKLNHNSVVGSYEFQPGEASDGFKGKFNLSLKVIDGRDFDPVKPMFMTLVRREQITHREAFTYGYAHGKGEFFDQRFRPDFPDIPEAVESYLRHATPGLRVFGIPTGDAWVRILFSAVGTELREWLRFYHNSCEQVVMRSNGYKKQNALWDVTERRADSRFDWFGLSVLPFEFSGDPDYYSYPTMLRRCSVTELKKKSDWLWKLETRKRVLQTGLWASV